MKKFYYLVASMVFVLVVIMACEKSAIGVDETLTVKDDVLLSKSENAPEKEKVAICHWDAEEGVYYSISVAPEAVGKHFANHKNENGDTMDKYSYSPEGTFVAVSSGHSVWDMSITYFDGTNFSGTAGFPAGAIDYKIYVDLSGMVSDDGTFFGHIDFGTGPQHDLTGTVDECGGITSLDWKWALIEDVEDIDGDGYYNNIDCDDTDPNEFPRQTWYIDADGDGYGASSTVACLRPIDGFLLSELADGSTGTDDCDDTKLPYSPEGDYHIDRANGAFLDITISFDGSNATVSGTGEDANGNVNYYYNTSFVINDNTFAMIVFQSESPNGEGTTHGKHTISGFISECDGIYNLSDTRGGSNYTLLAP